MNKKRYYLLGIITTMVFITITHLTLFQEQSPHVVLEELYYIPLFFGALLFGLRGAFWIYIVSSLLYLPFFYGYWAATFLDFIDRLLHLIFSGIFTVIAGFLVDRERRLQKQMEKDRYLAGIGQVAATIVHDLKNPLIVIMGFSKRIMEKKGNIGSAAQTIMESAQNMQRIVHDVLDFSKPIQLKL